MSNNLKPTKRKAFNFLRSYFDVLNQLDNDSDKLAFLTSIINKQFLDEDPKELSFIANLCYESQRHSIEKSVKGWITASNTDLLGNPILPLPLPNVSPNIPPKQEEQEQEQEEEQQKKDVFDFEDYKNQIAKEGNTTWMQAFYIQFKLKDKTFSFVVDDFILHLKCNEEIKHPKTLSKFKSHLYNWCNAVDPIGKLNKYKKHQPKQNGQL